MAVRKTKNEFILKANNLHGNRYDYSLVNYIDSKTKITIKCPKHGVFQQIPSDHLQGKGCRSCKIEEASKRLRMGRDEFIRRASFVHNNKYNYSKVDYKNGHDYIIVNCLIHGDFRQRAESHLRGYGCPSCANIARGNKLKIETKEFIERAIKIHMDRYDYSKVVYKNNRTDVEIVCKIHGPFFQNPSAHIRLKCGCPICASEKNASKRRLTKEVFINRSILVHGNKYDYSLVNYINNNTLVAIICPDHDVFWQIPSNHMKGSGCPKCLGMGLSTEEYIKKAKLVHGDKYDYSNTNYKGIKKDIQYRCLNHGIVTQSAESHLKSGCKWCANNQPIEKEEFLEMAYKKFGLKFNYLKIEYISYKKDKITIVCPEHKSFKITPFDHINSSQGCPKCGYKIMGQKKKISVDEFIRRAKLIHHDKYDYSSVQFKNMDDIISIKCPEHQIFKLKAGVHLYNEVGCGKCAGRNKTTDEYIEQAIATHGNKYDYSQVIYRKAIGKIKIVCLKHGLFLQQANLHLLGAGCPSCSSSRLENKVMRSLDIRNIQYECQKSFDWLKYRGKQFLDIYIPKYNLAIECQGTQHFMPTKRTGGESTYTERLIMDKNKYDLCKEYNVRILYYCPRADFIPDQYFDTIYHTIKELIDAIYMEQTK